MTSRGSVLSSMFNVQGGRYDLWEVWDGAKYINVTAALNSLAGIPDQIATDETRIQTLEDKTQSLDENKADTFVVVSQLFMKQMSPHSNCTQQSFLRQLMPMRLFSMAQLLILSFQVGERMLFWILTRINCQTLMTISEVQFHILWVPKNA